VNPNLLVVAYPELKLQHYDWIQRIRSKYDLLNFKVIEPHVTIVHETPELGPELFINAVSEILSQETEVQLELQSVLASGHSFSGDTSYIFLVLGQGSAEITRLRQKLYSGRLSKFQRHDIPFTPHITIGSGLQLERAKKVANQISDSFTPFTTRISCIDVIQNSPDEICSLRKFHLRA